MPRKKDIIRGGNGVPRLRENSRVMRAHESMVDLISGRSPQGSLLDMIASGFLGYDFGFLRSLDAELENELYSDSDDDDEPYYSHKAAPLAPHPRIRQLTQEEADKHAKELLEEEEKRKDKAERNKRKKLRKRERKQREKENAVKEGLPDEPTSSENKGENLIIDNNDEEEKPAVAAPAETQNEVAGCDDSSGNNEEDKVGKMNVEGDGESKDLNSDNSFVSAAAFAPKEEPPEQTPTTGKKKKKKQLFVDQQPEKEEPEVLKEPEVQNKKEENHIIKEKTVEADVDDFARRSRELAAIGNRMAAAGQYEMAVKCFTDAIKYNPKEYKLFGNRSLCYERMHQYENALRDADVALSMEPNWIKGLFRRGKALCGLKRYYEASLTYKEVLRLNSSSVEAAQELKRAQTLHLMEMGFNWEQSSEALKTHATLEEAVEALFSAEGQQGPQDGQASKENPGQVLVQEEEEEQGEWIVMAGSRLKTQQVFSTVGQTRPKSQSPTPMSKNWVKPELFPIWVGSLAPTVTYATLYSVFSRAGTVYSIKMLLDHQCAFVHFTRKEDCEKAIQMINGMVVEGAPLAVRYPNKSHPELGVSKSALTDPFLRPVTGPASGKNIKECFFWRTTGCTKQEKCIYRHVPEHKNIDRDKVRL